jgi:hypothetical protein
MQKILIGLSISFSLIFASESFSHKDWEVVCDNMHTCRMAGYTEYTVDQTYFPISLYFERKAGASTVIESKIDFADYQENVDGKRLKNKTFKMFIGSKNFIIDLSKKIPQKITDAMIGALVKDKKIYFTYGDAYKWDFSEKGTFAVMTKMDNYQKRIGTVGAMFKKGHKNEDHVLQPKPIPRVNAPQIYSNSKGNRTPPEVTLQGKNKKLLHYLLGKYYGEGEGSVCWMDAKNAVETLKVYRLTDKVAIASQSCWIAAYNYADAFWLINTKPPFEPRFINTANNLFISDDGTLRMSSAYKGRGIGDCWGNDEWVWDGKEFVETSHATTGLCRGFTGGAWELPTLITKVKVQSPFLR